MQPSGGRPHSDLLQMAGLCPVLEALAERCEHRLELRLLVDETGALRLNRVAKEVGPLRARLQDSGANTHRPELVRRCLGECFDSELARGVWAKERENDSAEPAAQVDDVSLPCFAHVGRTARFIRRMPQTFTSNMPWIQPIALG